jgi:hypothetical protein
MRMSTSIGELSGWGIRTSLLAVATMITDFENDGRGVQKREGVQASRQWRRGVM